MVNVVLAVPFKYEQGEVIKKLLRDFGDMIDFYIRKLLRTIQLLTLDGESLFMKNEGGEGTTQRIFIIQRVKLHLQC